MEVRCVCVCGGEFPGPGQQGPFKQGALQTRISSLTVCLCGSSKRSCWRKSPFTWPVWSELEGFLPAGLLVAVWRIKVQRLGVTSSLGLQLHNCLKQFWNENSTPEATLIVWIGMPIQDGNSALSYLLIHEYLDIFRHSEATSWKNLPNHKRYDVSRLKSSGFRDIAWTSALFKEVPAIFHVFINCFSKKTSHL